jgi:Ribosomal protein L3
LAYLRKVIFVTVSGKSKGRGFSGTVKKYSFSQQRKTHGQGDTHRHVGSIGAASDPSRVFPGKKMPSRYGNKKVSVKSLEVIKVDRANNQLLIKGSIPGSTNGIVVITR